MAVDRWILMRMINKVVRTNLYEQFPRLDVKLSLEFLVWKKCLLTKTRRPAKHFLDTGDPSGAIWDGQCWPICCIKRFSSKRALNLKINIFWYKKYKKYMESLLCIQNWHSKDWGRNRTVLKGFWQLLQNYLTVQVGPFEELEKSEGYERAYL